MRLAPAVSGWTPVLLVLALIGGVFLSMGYGIIGIAFLFVLVAVCGGALMSYIDSD
jgi:hypothetical protein